MIKLQTLCHYLCQLHIVTIQLTELLTTGLASDRGNTTNEKNKTTARKKMILEI